MGVGVVGYNPDEFFGFKVDGPMAGSGVLVSGGQCTAP